MKWVNIGDVEEFDLYSNFTTVKDNEMNYSNTSRGIKATSNGLLIHKLPEEITEAWVSFDVALNNSVSSVSYNNYSTLGFNGDNAEQTTNLPSC